MGCAAVLSTGLTELGSGEILNCREPSSSSSSLSLLIVDKVAPEMLLLDSSAAPRAGVLGSELLLAICNPCRRRKASKENR